MEISTENFQALVDQLAVAWEAAGLLAPKHPLEVAGLLEAAGLLEVVGQLEAAGLLAPKHPLEVAGLLEVA